MGQKGKIEIYRFELLYPLHTSHAESVARLHKRLARSALSANLHDKLWILISDLAWSQQKILTPEQTASILMKAAQIQGLDGGISLRDLGIKPKGAFEYPSDTYASSLVAIAFTMSHDASYECKLRGIEEWLRQFGTAVSLQPTLTISPKAPGITYCFLI